MVTLLPAFVGSFLVLTAALKAFYSRLFIIHVKRFKLIPERPAALAALLFIEMEAGLGTALILGVYPRVLIPATFGLVVLFSLLTGWGYTYRKLDECGCYGGVIRLSPIQSLTVNAFILCLLGISWLPAGTSRPDNSQNLYLVVVVVLVFHLVAKHTVRKPAIDLLRLKKGALWNDRLYRPDCTDTCLQGVLFIIVERHCSLCQSWIQDLAEKTDHELHYQVIILLSERSGKTDQQAESFELRFPVHKIGVWASSLLAGRLPMAIKVEEQVILEIKTGDFPEDDFFRR